MGKHFKRNKTLKRAVESTRLKKTIDKLNVEEGITDKKDYDHYLSAEDRVRWVMEFNEKVLKKITIGYEIEVNKEWVMIKMYDNTHDTDYLHRHTKESLQNPREIYSTDHVVKKGTPSDWLNWARKDIFNNWFYYRRAFLKRSKLVDN